MLRLTYLNKNFLRWPTKINMERVYDKVSWDYLSAVLQQFNFHPSFVDWISDGISKSKLCVLVNDILSDLFYSSVGLKQDCPLPWFHCVIFKDVD